MNLTQKTTLNRGFAVHIGNLKMAAIPEVFPNGNVIGAMLVGRLIQSTLSQHGLMYGETLAGGTLGDCIVLVPMPLADQAAAVGIVMEALKDAALLNYSQIAILDEAGKWRCVFPSADVKMDYLMDMERQEHLLEQIREVFARLKKNDTDA